MFMNWSYNYIAITNDIEHALLLNNCGIQQIMIDTESIGKAERQFGKNAVINFHKLEDVYKLKKLNLSSKIICRINGYNKNSFNEIEKAIEYGADILMLPMIQNIDQYFEMVNKINKRVPILPLIETSYSMFKLKEIIKISNPEQIHFGLNDLQISIGMKNLFEVLLSPLFSSAVSYAKHSISKVGIGGIGDPTKSHKISPNLLLNEYKLLGSNSVILSRSFFEKGYDQKHIISALTIFESNLFKEPNLKLHNQLLKDVEKF
jgi:hypothetical protein